MSLLLEIQGGPWGRHCGWTPRSPVPSPAPSLPSTAEATAYGSLPLVARQPEHAVLAHRMKEKIPGCGFQNRFSFPERKEQSWPAGACRSAFFLPWTCLLKCGWGEQSGKTESLTCGVWRSLQVHNARTELNCMTPSWCLRTAWYGEKNPTLWNWVEN